MDIEQRAYELFGERLLMSQRAERIMREFRVTEGEAFAVMRKVLNERGTPRSNEIRELLAQARAYIAQI